MIKQVLLWFSSTGFQKYGIPGGIRWWPWQTLDFGLWRLISVAPDFRGFGLSEVPADPEKTTFRDLVDDLLELFDSFELPRVFLVGKDFGARVVDHFGLLHQERVSGLVTMGLPFMPTGPTVSLDPLPRGFYFMRFREPGRAEKDFGRFDVVKTVVKKIYILFKDSELQVAGENQEIMDLVDASAELPPWFTEEDLTNYAKLYEKSGFQTAMQIPLRAWLESDGVPDPKVKVPSLLIMGEKDYALRFLDLEEYIRSGKVKEYVPDLEITFLPEGNHCVQEQFPGKVNQLLVGFLNKHRN